MQPKRLRRFYERASLRPGKGGFELALDDRPARTPGRNPLCSSNRAVMERVADEWARQGEVIDPSAMPLTRLLNTAIDGVSRTMAETRADTAAYADFDLLYYRAEEPEVLADRQRAAFDPVLDWATRTFGAPFRLATGIMPVAQAPEAGVAIRAAIGAFEDPVALAALSVMTSLAGSVLLALAVAHERLTAEEAWRLAHLDEEFQAERWGVDEDASARRKARWREMEAAAIVLAAYRADRSAGRI